MSFQTNTQFNDLGGGGGGGSGLAMILLSRACNCSHWSLFIAWLSKVLNKGNLKTPATPTLPVCALFITLIHLFVPLNTTSDGHMQRLKFTLLKAQYNRACTQHSVLTKEVGFPMVFKIQQLLLYYAELTWSLARLLFTDSFQLHNMHTMKQVLEPILRNVQMMDFEDWYPKTVKKDASVPNNSWFGCI